MRRKRAGQLSRWENVLLEFAPDEVRHENRDDEMRYVAYVPPGSIGRGERLAHAGKDSPAKPASRATDHNCGESDRSHRSPGDRQRISFANYSPFKPARVPAQLGSRCALSSRICESAA